MSKFGIMHRVTEDYAIWDNRRQCKEADVKEFDWEIPLAFLPLEYLPGGLQPREGETHLIRMSLQGKQQSQQEGSESSSSNFDCHIRPAWR